MQVPKILSSIVNGLSDVKKDASTKANYNVPVGQTDFYSGTDIVNKIVENPYGFDDACNNFAHLTKKDITKVIYGPHPQLVVNGPVPTGATCVYPDGEC